MSVGMRHFLLDGDELRPLPEATLAGLREGRLSLPRYAGQELHVVDVTVELRDRQPIAVKTVAGRVLPLDDDGRMKSQLMDQLRASIGQKKLRGWRPTAAQTEHAKALALGKAKAKRRPPAAKREAAEKQKSSEQITPSARKRADGASSPSRAFKRGGHSRSQRGYHAAPPRANRSR